MADTLKSLAHYQRSSDCKFFAFSAPAKQRSGRPKKGRASKASRTSTQSVFTSVSDGGSITEVEINEDSILAMPAVECEQSTETTRGKKSRKPRRAPTKAKTKALNTTLHELAKSSSFIEPEDDDFEVKIEKAPAKKENIYKRKSNEMEERDIHGSIQTISDPDMNPPPAKRRTTRASSSIVAVGKTSNKPSNNAHGYDMEIDDTENTAPPCIPTIKKGSTKGVKKGRKGTSSAVRKASATSTAPMASPGGIIPSDDALEAALEADLDRPLTDNEVEAEQPEIQYPKMRRLTRTRPGSRDGPPSLAPVRRTMRLSSPPLQASSLGEDSLTQVTSGNVVGSDHAPRDEVKNDAIATRSASRLSQENVLQSFLPVEDARLVGLPSDLSAANAKDASIQMKPKQKKSKKPMKSRPASRHLSKRGTQPLIPSPKADLPSSNHNSVTSAQVSQVCEDGSGNETDVSVVMKSLPKECRGKGKQGNNTAIISPESEEVMQRELENAFSQPEPLFIATAIDPVKNATPIILSHDIQIASPSEEEVVELIEPSETTARSKSFLGPRESVKSVKGREKQTPIKSPIAVQPVEQTPATPHVSGSERESTPLQASPVVENPACVPSVQTTPRPAASPQSSDVENQPPSSRPSSVRPPLLISSPPKPQTTRIPLVTTPSISPSKRYISRLQSTMPWSAIDYDKIFLGSPADKENNPFVLKPAIDGETVGLSSPEKLLSLEEWIQFNAQKGEEHFRSECERVIGKFEGEGVRALKTLEGITCVD